MAHIQLVELAFLAVIGGLALALIAFADFNAFAERAGLRRKRALAGADTPVWRARADQRAGNTGGHNAVDNIANRNGFWHAHLQ